MKGLKFFTLAISLMFVAIVQSAEPTASHVNTAAGHSYGYTLEFIKIEVTKRE